MWHLQRFGSALLAGVLLALLVHWFGGDEQAICEDGSRCALGSGISWFFTGWALVLPTLVLLGFLWVGSLYDRGQGGPFAYTPIPDWEEQAEALAFILSLLIAYVIIDRGPKTPLVEAEWPNAWLVDRLGEQDGHPLAPSRFAWFLIGVIFGITPSFAFGSAVGRGWFGWKDQQPPSANGLGSDTI